MPDSQSATESAGPIENADSQTLQTLAQEALHALQGQTLAVAESVTGGLLSAYLTAIPGASATYLGGVTTYATNSKVKILGVDRRLIDQAGVIQSSVAQEMAVGVATLFGANVGIGITGVAGPADQDGRQPGTVFLVAVRVGQEGQVLQVESGQLALKPEDDTLGDFRQFVRQQAVKTALCLLLSLAK